MSPLQPHISKIKAMLDLLEQLPLPAMILHKQCVLAWNLAAQATLGWTKDEVVGEKLPASEDQERQLTAFLSWIRSGEVMVTTALTLRTKDGAELTATFMGAAVNDDPLRELCLLVMASNQQRGERDIYYRMRSQLQVIQFNAELLAAGSEIDTKQTGERIVAAVNNLARALSGLDPGATPRAESMDWDVEDETAS